MGLLLHFSSSFPRLRFFSAFMGFLSFCDISFLLLFFISLRLFFLALCPCHGVLCLFLFHGCTFLPLFPCCSRGVHCELVVTFYYSCAIVFRWIYLVALDSGFMVLIIWLFVANLFPFLPSLVGLYFSFLCSRGFMLLGSGFVLLPSIKRLATRLF